MKPTSKRNNKCRKLWFDHRLPDAHIMQGRCVNSYNPQLATWLHLPELLYGLSHARNIRNVYVTEGGISICQDYTEDWSYTLADVRAVLEKPFVQRWLGPQPLTCEACKEIGKPGSTDPRRFRAFASHFLCDDCVEQDRIWSGGFKMPEQWILLELMQRYLLKRRVPKTGGFAVQGFLLFLFETVRDRESLPWEPHPAAKSNNESVLELVRQATSGSKSVARPSMTQTAPVPYPPAK